MKYKISIKILSIGQWIIDQDTNRDHNDITIIVVIDDNYDDILTYRHPICYNVVGRAVHVYTEGLRMMEELSIVHDKNGSIDVLLTEGAGRPSAGTDLAAPRANPKAKMSLNYTPRIMGAYEFFNQIPDENAALAFIESVRWDDGVFCPNCASDRVGRVYNGKPLSHKCRHCRRHFSVRSGTILAKTQIPLKKWLYAIYLFHTGRAGVSSHELGRLLGITQKSAWFLAHRIREAMSDAGASDVILGGEVEVDETYIGGRLGRMHKDKREEAREKPNQGKVIVMGIRERSTGRVWTRAIPDTMKGTLQRIIGLQIEPGTVVYTDGHEGYTGIEIEFDDLTHEVVYHSGPDKRYVRAKLDAAGNLMYDENGEPILIHTNGIESFWALFKRGYRGVYFYMSPNHLHRYLNESSYRQGLGKINNFDAITDTVRRLFNKRLTHKQLIGKAAG